MLLSLMIVALTITILPAAAFAAIPWTPLIASTDFAGITTDVQTSATGIITVLLIVLGVGLLARVFMR